MILRFYRTGTTTYYDIRCSVVYGTNWFKRRLNQSSVLTTDGSRSTFDIGPSMIKCNINIKSAVSFTSNDLKEFFASQVIFKTYSFYVVQFKDDYSSFTSGSGVDLGLGKGVTLSNVYLDVDDYSLEGIFTLVPPGVDDINIPIEYRSLV